MTAFEAIVRGLIALVVIAITIWLVVYVLGVIGFVIPASLLPLLWVLGLLVLILYIYKIVKPQWGKWFPPG